MSFPLKRHLEIKTEIQKFDDINSISLKRLFQVVYVGLAHKILVLNK